MHNMQALPPDGRRYGETQVILIAGQARRSRASRTTGRSWNPSRERWNLPHGEELLFHQRPGCLRPRLRSVDTNVQCKAGRSFFLVTVMRARSREQ
jgi:hypothetical protein